MATIAGMASRRTVSAREFSRFPTRARNLATRGPVFITDRGRTSHVLLSIEKYQALAGSGSSIVDMLAMPQGADMEFEPPRAGQIFRRSDS